MKKILGTVLWIAATIAVIGIYLFLTGFLLILGNIVLSIAGHSEIDLVTNSQPLNIIWWGGTLALIVASAVLYVRWSRKCPVCKHWNAVFLANTDCLKEDNISVLVKCEHRDAQGHPSGSHDQYVPGKRKTYRNTYECRFCGNTTTRIYTKDSATL